MANKQYLSGRRFEYDTMKRWKAKGYEVLRTAGSHGAFDVIAYKPGLFPVFVQCKVVANKAAATRLLKNFNDNAPLCATYLTCIEVKVKGSNNIQTSLK